MRLFSCLPFLGLTALSFGQYSALSLHPAGFEISNGRGIGHGQQVGFVLNTSSGFVQNAALWSGSAASFVNLNPFANGQSVAFAAYGGSQGGYATDPANGGNNHAALWTGTAASFVDLHPAGFVFSQVAALSSSQQVGQVFDGSVTFGAIWSGTAGSFQNLNPAGATSSALLATDGMVQGGYATLAGVSEAGLWSNTVGSFVSLHPGTGYDASQVNGLGGGQQVGSAFGSATSFNSHAVMWTGSAGSFVDLHDAAYMSSRAHAADGTYQVGWVASDVGIQTRAARWSGSAASMLDLHQFLSSDYDTSVALGIDIATGDIVGQAHNATLNRFESVMWQAQPVPEPATLAVVGLGFLALRRRKRS